MALFKSILLLILINFTIKTESARILSLFTSPCTSHVIVFMPIAKALSERGHNVTVVTSISLPKELIPKNSNYRHIKVKSDESLREFVKDVISKPKSIYSAITRMTDMYGIIFESVNKSLNDENMIRLMKEEKFDLILFGYFFNDYQLGLAAHFKCPVVMIFMIQPIAFINSMVGNPTEVSYVPNLMLGAKQPLTFLARIQNFLISVLGWIGGHIFEAKTLKSYRMHFPADKYPSLDEVRKNISFVLVNHHFSQGPIRPLVPAIIEIGGIQIKEKPDLLPDDIQKFMDMDDGYGIILFSLGSNVHSADLNEDKIQMIFNVLSKLPQKVIWKWEADNKIPGKSNRILYKKWLPQDDILAHKNLKLFITHGGLGGVVEAKYHGVPMIGLPMFGDQFFNLIEVENNGYGISLDYDTLNETIFYDTIMEVLNNSTYKERVESFSKLYKDRPLSALQTAIYWTEYTIRHNGAKHLRSPATDMNIIQLYSLDVIALIFIILYLLCKLIAVSFRFMFYQICKRIHKKKLKKNKNE